ncbi:MAG: 2-oxo acid dehydrogenase subunit E2 [Planctomycetota bacterium]
MSATGIYRPVSRFRRLVADLMHFSAKVPSVTLERRMNLAPLVAARQNCDPSPTWTAIITKAYAVVAARTPALRTAYLTFPWPRFYEHAANIATLHLDRQLADERVVLYVHIESPETLSLAALDAIIHDHQHQPVENIASYRVAVRLSAVPWPFRRLIWWAGLNILGSRRSRYFGTFGLTSLGAQGAGITHLVPLLTTQLHFGMLDPAGVLDVRLSFDHRVIDGAPAAQALAELEAVLLGEMIGECTAGSA